LGSQLACRFRIPCFLISLGFASLACSQTDIFKPPSTSAPPVQGPSTAQAACKPASTATEEADILFNAQVAEHKQSGISITVLYQNSTQLIEFVNPNRFHWRTESGGVWEEVIHIAGTTYVSSSTQGWVAVPVLDPTYAALMQGFIDPPVKGSAAEMEALLTQAGYTDIKLEGRLVGFVPDFFGTCVYELTFKSGDTVIYSQKTWIGPNDGLRYKFEAKDETRTVTEARLFDYDNITINAP